MVNVSAAHVFIVTVGQQRLAIGRRDWDWFDHNPGSLVWTERSDVLSNRSFDHCLDLRRLLLLA